MNEEWKIYKNQFAVSTQGIVINLKTSKRIKPSLNYNGYMYIDLRGEDWRENKRHHRLLAELFIPNPKNLPQVNHIDGDKTNNDLGNLEWCDNGYNQLKKNQPNPPRKNFTLKEIKDIRKDCGSMSMSQLCKKYHTNYHTIKEVLNL